MIGHMNGLKSMRNNGEYGIFTDMILQERYLVNDEDLYYNKDKWDNGETNLCFITGHSGSGKSTMGSGMQKDNITWINLDDLQCVKDHFTMDNLKEYSNLIYSFFAGPGKKWYIGRKDDLPKELEKEGEYERVMFNDFIDYAIKYSKSHKNERFVIEGIWLFLFIEPSKLKDYAVYVKGTSALISKLRGIKRDTKNDMKDAKDNKEKAKIIVYSLKAIVSNRNYIEFEGRIKRFKKYFENLMKK